MDGEGVQLASLLAGTCQSAQSAGTGLRAEPPAASLFQTPGHSASGEAVHCGLSSHSPSILLSFPLDSTIGEKPRCPLGRAGLPSGQLLTGQAYLPVQIPQPSHYLPGPGVTRIPAKLWTPRDPAKAIRSMPLRLTLWSEDWQQQGPW